MLSPPRRRRKSSFFCRYALTVNDNENANEEIQLNQSDNFASPKIEINRDEIVSNHVVEMKREISDWKKMYQTTQSKYVDTEKCKNDVILDWAECKDDLTEEDIAFCTAKPNYEELILKMNNLAESIEIVKCKLSRTDAKIDVCMKTNCRIIHQMKEDLCSVLLNCGESNNFSSFEDSGNCSMEVVEMEVIV